MEQYSQVLLEYLWEIVPALAVGFLISGLVHELVPEDVVFKHLGGGGMRPILYATVVGTILPVCCWGSLPIAVSFRKKGARLGPVLAFLVATPATSISALVVVFSVLGARFALYTFAAVILMGLGAGFLGDFFHVDPRLSPDAATPCCSNCESEIPPKRSRSERAKSALRFAYVTLPKDIGAEILAGVLIAAAVGAFAPVQHFIHNYLGGWMGYTFSVVFGIVTYLCSTASVPLVDSLVKQGLAPGAGMTLLLIGPITSYGTMLVLRKEFGAKVLVAFLVFLTIASLVLGVGFQALIGVLESSRL